MCEHLGYSETRSFTLQSSGDTLVGQQIGRAVDSSRERFNMGPLPLPARCWLDYLTVYVVDIDGAVTSPTTLALYLTRDELGTVPIGNRLDDDDNRATWDVVTTDAGTRGGASARIDLPYHRTSEGEAMYLWAYGVDSAAGLIVRAEVHWHVTADLDLTERHRERLQRERGILNRLLNPCG